MEPLNPELWKEIFTDPLYLIPEKDAPVPTAEKKTVTASAVEIPKPVVTADNKKEPSTTLPESPRLPVQPKAEKPLEIPVTPPVQALKPEGRYINGVLILMHASQKMTPPQQEMLAKIVKAVQLDLNDCGILSVPAPVDMSALQILKPRFVLSFGIARESFTPALLKDYYAIQKQSNSMFLLSDSLSNLEKTDTLKRNLWNALKELFSLN